MPRPVKPRWIAEDLSMSVFGPLENVPTGELSLPVEGMEALRLSDHERMDQEAAAALMGVSRQTYGRILADARGIVAHALLTGKALRVEGGSYRLRRRRGRRLQQRGIRGHEDETAFRKGGCTMPGGDGKGPDGQGPVGKGKGGCGKGRGRCNPSGNRRGGGFGGRNSGGEKPADSSGGADTQNES